MTTDPDDISPSYFTCLLFGALDSFRRGSLKVWDVTGEVWRDVNPTDPLTASIYLYHVQVVVSLSKISARVGRSETEATGNASTMARRVKARDGNRCWVSRFKDSITNSHVCPKRMGDHLLRVVYNIFVAAPPPALSIYDEICGITLIDNLDTKFDKYELGLWFVAPVRNSSLLVFYSQSWFMNLG